MSLKDTKVILWNVLIKTHHLIHLSCLVAPTCHHMLKREWALIRNILWIVLLGYYRVYVVCVL